MESLCANEKPAKKIIGIPTKFGEQLELGCALDELILEIFKEDTNDKLTENEICRKATSLIKTSDSFRQNYEKVKKYLPIRNFRDILILKEIYSSSLVSKNQFYKN